MLKKYFFFRLETAAMIIGWFETIGSILSVLIFGFCLGYVDDIVKEIINQAKESDQINPDEVRKGNKCNILYTYVYMYICM